jgi:hypothetical protein
MKNKAQLKKFVVDIYTTTNLHIRGVVVIRTIYNHLRIGEFVKLADRNKTGFIAVDNAEIYRSGAVETLIRRDSHCAVSVYSIVSISAKEVEEGEKRKEKAKETKETTKEEGSATGSVT